jgi:hypothetical protein
MVFPPALTVGGRAGGTAPGIAGGSTGVVVGEDVGVEVGTVFGVSPPASDASAATLPPHPNINTARISEERIPSM